MGSAWRRSSSVEEGYDHAVRPQDDLFGHVNGRWYDTVEIPADLPGYGQFVGLRLTSEQRVGDLLREAAEAAESGSAAPGSTSQQIGDMFASFLDEDHVESLGAEPIRADLEAVQCGLQPDRAGRPDRAAGARGRCGWRVRVVRQHRRPQVGPVRRQHHPGRDRPARRGLLPRGPVRGDPRRVRRPHRADARAGRRRGRRGRGRAGHEPRDATRRRALGRGRLPRRHRDLQPAHLRRAGRGRTRLRLRRLVGRPRCARRRLRRGHRPAAELPHHAVGGAHRRTPRRLEGLAHLAGRPLVGAVPHQGDRHRELRLLLPDPRRHRGPAGPLEARRRRGPVGAR